MYYWNPKKSSSCVVSTMLETPPVPRVAPLRGVAEVAGAALKLVWDPAAVFAKGLSQREQRKHNIEKIEEAIATSAPPNLKPGLNLLHWLGGHLRVTA